MMIRTDPALNRTCPEREVYNELLQLDGKTILDLGCGKADVTRAIASEGHDRQITALEVDEIQHRNHLAMDDLPNVQFIMAGAENIPCAESSFDVAFMFKSLHHVPLPLMQRALLELRRVLKPGGYAYISEPVFDGDFNNLLKMFHNEEKVRLAAFEAVKLTVDLGLLSLERQYFFNAPMHFDNFADFEQKILQATHTDHSLSDTLYEQVKLQFESHMGKHGADFQMPIRIDLLRKDH
ncbi:MAG: SAM-dependent methyltransferase [Zetaproteobacteria bacterium CG12_big_fil_rev_8_21_14_0_65_54_13]|nr:MAG: SAM-dependent methyltransferase [Zetaproteobacteria bacterium CG23_combo_of_CG06-09_8_20_14_all_54_7]PIW44922.1 MAG: SAM-dependent methyltransferase [Zetaproteobacteria bacterium CG12_big_fil_rev_8_21_14_0_65_54_13]PIX55948.1 MAG: SAM-dependent methyltransferase [Zetaproteobacteria bacterium CG_4_10_14_3_um_filter_54_28]PJA30721.1 MAG: SAM-dependent methyltransferase [Zetaproteobacteria bacterium CG_4_9_14_3_um_filter_54_145]